MRYLILLTFLSLHCFARNSLENCTHTIMQPLKDLQSSPVIKGLAGGFSGAIGYYLADRYKKNKPVIAFCSTLIGLGLSTSIEAQYTLSKTPAGSRVDRSVYDAFPGGIIWTAIGILGIGLSIVHNAQQAAIIS